MAGTVAAAFAGKDLALLRRQLGQYADILVVRLGDLSATERIEMYAQALRLTERAQEKKLVLGGLASVKALEALQMAEP